MKLFSEWEIALLFSFFREEGGDRNGYSNGATTNFGKSGVESIHRFAILKETW
jgi:hypothetical protein